MGITKPSPCPACSGSGRDEKKTVEERAAGRLVSPAVVRCWECQGTGVYRLQSSTWTKLMVAVEVDGEAQCRDAYNKDGQLVPVVNDGEVLSTTIGGKFFITTIRKG